MQSPLLRATRGERMGTIGTTRTSPRSEVVGLQQQLQQFTSMSGHQLRTEWHRAFRAEPPSGLTRDLLIRALAYRIQECATGGLSQACRRTLRSLAGQLSLEGARGALKLPVALAPGVRRVRDWGGRTHTVLVLESGFEYRGERHRSLTEVARRITGARWSGPRFFGLTSSECDPKPGSERISPRRTTRSPGRVGADGQI